MMKTKTTREIVVMWDKETDNKPYAVSERDNVEWVRVDDMINYLDVLYNVEYGERRKIVTTIKNHILSQSNPNGDDKNVKPTVRLATYCWDD
jgi:hypothetical protein